MVIIIISFVSGKRVGESVIKTCSFTGVACTPDGKTTFAVGTDKTLKEISDSQVEYFSFHFVFCVFVCVAFLSDRCAPHSIIDGLYNSDSF